MNYYLEEARKVVLSTKYSHHMLKIQLTNYICIGCDTEHKGIHYIEATDPNISNISEFWLCDKCFKRLFSNSETEELFYIDEIE